MAQKKKQHPKEKTALHPRNKHRERYDFKALIQACPDLAPFVSLNQYDDESINFSDPKAVMMLNRAILTACYGVDQWAIPEGFLCPPVPGRADYIHYIADLLAQTNDELIPTGNTIHCLDIGVGANCIYPIVGNREYGWSFVGADVEQEAIDSAMAIVNKNEVLKGQIELRLQANTYDTFKNMIKEGEHYDITMCNPPFHASMEEAKEGTRRKLSSLNKKEVSKVVLNFGGKSRELYCQGGEERFVTNMIKQSSSYKESCLWFTTLVSKQDNVRPFKKVLKSVGAVEVKTVKMAQGTKVSRFIAWTFHHKEQQKAWANKHWTK